MVDQARNGDGNKDKKLTAFQGGVGNRVTSRSKYGTKKPKKVQD